MEVNTSNVELFTRELYYGHHPKLGDSQITALEIKLNKIEAEAAQIRKLLGYRYIGISFDPLTLEVRKRYASSFSEYHSLLDVETEFFLKYQGSRDISLLRSSFKVTGRSTSTSKSAENHYINEMRQYLASNQYPHFGGCPPCEDNYDSKIGIVEEKRIHLQSSNSNEVIDEYVKLHRRGVDIGWLARWCAYDYFQKHTNFNNLSISHNISPNLVNENTGRVLGEFGSEQKNGKLISYLPLAAKCHLMGKPSRYSEIPKSIRNFYFDVSDGRHGSKQERDVKKYVNNLGNEEVFFVGLGPQEVFQVHDNVLGEPNLAKVKITIDLENSLRLQNSTANYINERSVDSNDNPNVPCCCGCGVNAAGSKHTCNVTGGLVMGFCYPDEYTQKGSEALLEAACQFGSSFSCRKCFRHQRAKKRMK